MPEQECDQMASDEKNTDFTPDAYEPETIPDVDEAAAAEEAAEYYRELEKNRDEDLIKEQTETKNNEPEPKRRLLRFDFDIDDSLIEEIYEFPSQKKNDLLFYSACIFVAAAFLCTVFYVGVSSSSSDDEIADALDRMRASDSSYAEAIAENEQLTEEIKELTRQSLEAQELTGALGNYEDMKQSLETKLEEAKANFQSKNDELYNLNQELSALKAQQNSYSVTLTPGVYIVGQNIPAGTYDITGAGSIIAATAAGETRINMQLSEDAPSRAELKNGYTVKINRMTGFALSAAENAE